MPNQITEFSIRKLHGQLTLTVPISDNKIVLVGSNGLGKTTIVSIFFYFLTRQWARLLEYDFENVSIVVDGESISVAREDLISPVKSVLQNSFFDTLPSEAAQRLTASPEFRRLVVTMQHGPSPDNFDDLSLLARRVGVPISLVERLLITSRREFSVSGRRKNKISDALQKAENILLKISPQVLYLPTYRRIEQDLKSIFPEFESEFKKILKTRASRSQDMRGGFVELVEFGMEDVDSRISARLGALKDSSRVELNNLAGGYLRDVIRGEARQWDEKQIERLTDSEIQLILGRVEEKQLNEHDKTAVFDVINNVRQNKGLTGDQELLAHFFSKLVSIHEAQRKAEIPIRQFAKVCNKYLQRKELKYDDANFELPLILTSGDKIEMRQLSSGEKQIVSLFAHVYLGLADRFFVIIDEPELSLSVEWQRTLLPDLIESQRCEFLAAVTHSPFIYDNGLEQYTRDLARFIHKAS